MKRKDLSCPAVNRPLKKPSMPRAHLVFQRVKHGFSGLVPGIMLFVAVFVAALPVSAAVDTTATASIRVTVNRIFSLLKDKSLATESMRQKRRGLIVAEVDNRFDFSEMSMRAMGRGWRKRTRTEKLEFVDLFAALLKKTYIRRIEAYSNEVVEFRKEIRRGKRAMVYSVVLKNGNEIPINYAMKLKNSQWRVYDVVIEGVSLVRNYRTEFTRILGRENYVGLVRRLRRKLDELAREDKGGNV